jgi:hypothetical protein
MSGVVLVQFSTLNLKKYIAAGRASLDRNLAQAADSADYEPPLHHMLCVASLKNPDAKFAKDVIPYLGMFQAGFLVAADERDWAEILEIASMPSIMVPSLDRSTNVGMLTGTLLEWHAAILRGCQKEVGSEARHTYNLIYSEFKNLGLAPAFQFDSKPNSRDQTFLLEYKP